jgi:hypothetical protein
MKLIIVASLLTYTTACAEIADLPEYLSPASLAASLVDSGTTNNDAASTSDDAALADTLADALPDVSHDEASPGDAAPADASPADASPADAATTTPSNMWVQGAHVTQTGTSSSATFSAPVMAQNAIVVLGDMSSDAALVAVSDTLGSTFTTAVRPVGSEFAFMAVAFNVTGGHDTITAAFDGSITADLFLEEYRIDSLDSAGYTTGNGINIAANATTSTASELVLGFVLGGESNPESGFFTRYTDCCHLIEDALEPSIGMTPVTATRAAPGAWLMMVGTFQVK